jgi:uncharacterized membrane protein
MRAVSKNSKRQLGGLLLLGIVLRLINLARESLWLDEAISYLAAQLPLSQIANNTVQSSHPPLYYFLLHFWLELVPDTDTAVKLISVFFGILLIPATYLLCQKLFSNRTISLTAAALTAVSPFHILYSHELRMYTQLMLLVVVGTLVYWQARQKKSIGWWLLFGAIFLLAVYTHLFAFLALAGIGLHALLEYRQNRSAFWQTAVTILLISLCFIPWLQLMLADVNPELGSLRPLQSAEILNPLKPITAPVFLLFGMSGTFWYSGLILFIFLAYIIIFVMELRKLGRSQIPDGLKLSLLIIVCVLGLPLLVYLIRPFFLPERTLAAAAPFLIILLGWGVSRRQSPLPYLTGIALLLMLVGTINYHIGPLVKPPYRAATAYVADHAAPGEIVLHTSDGSYLPALRYAPQLTQGVLAGDPDPRKAEAVFNALGGEVWTLEESAAQSNGRFWVVVALEHSIDWQLAQYDIIAAQYSLLEEHEIGDIGIFLFGQAK